MKKIKFLDMEIVDYENSDGVTLVIKGCSYGNFGNDWDTAKIWALRWFLVLRPEIFGHSILFKLYKQHSGSYGEYSKLVDVCKEQNLEIPEGVTGDNFSRLIMYKGIVI